ncbi:RNA polymerase sigma factor [Flavobacterium arcticum]|uniref:RNA polymerase sigma factor n=1 Tax=Flavobacterium arcticum TaxID=1784713 RepID=A0A345HCY7_9FLAO|nr:RNA polymerase sigma factor [Flavobacterium arcticum]AXG74447.1 RNA polymerase sigma factor [Flavobacterium arcticum]KAF2512432.1 RNA polymerase sigma factor [Flavobacterium arcticum]
MEDEKAFISELLNPKTQEAAFRKLMAQYSRPLYSHIRNIVINHDDTDDVLQNTFIKIFKNLPNFKEQSKLFSWMYRIATNEAITFINQRAKKSGITNEEVQQKALQNLEADEYFEGDTLQLQLQQAVAKLPEKQQLVFKMKYFEDLKYEEISEILNTSVGALKASYHHAVKKIEEYIKSL